MLFSLFTFNHYVLNFTFMKTQLNLVVSLIFGLGITFQGNSQINFQPFVNAPFGISGTGFYSAPTFADLDMDGDLDMISGSATAGAGNFYYYENTGSSTAPTFNAPQINPFSLTGLGVQSSPVLADLDADGDFDLLCGDNSGRFFYYENTGSATTPSFGAVQINPFSLIDIGELSTPELIDIDGDGDLDLFAGLNNGGSGLRFFQNIGTSASPLFGSVVFNPFGIIANGQESNCDFVDLDKDGDFDLMFSAVGGNFYYYENIGTSISPSFTSSLVYPFSLTPVGNYLTPTFVDIDADGDADIISGEAFGSFAFVENAPNSPSNTSLPADTLVCEKNTTSLSASGIGAISWYDAPTGGNYLGSGNTFSTPQVLVPTTYYAQDSTMESGASVSRTAINIFTNPLPDVSISLVADVISADLSGASYEWVKCPSYVAAPGATNSQDYTITQNGSYAVIINDGTCIDTSLCVTLNNLGVDELPTINTNVFPNPVNEM